MSKPTKKSRRETRLFFLNFCIAFLYIDINFVFQTIQIFTAMPKVNFTVNPDAAPMHSTRGHHKGLVKSYQDCFGMTPEFHGKDKHCIFPFIYRGIVIT